jgi:protein-disulfide isomerase
VKLDVWSDFQCAACRVFAGRIKPALVRSYIETGKARLAFHDMSFLGSESLGAAMSARCADRQGKFWPYHDLLLANQGATNSGVYTRERSKEFAATLRLNVAAFSTCLDDPAIQEAVEAETRQAYVRGIKETPTLLVNGVAVTEVNNWQVVSAAIEAALKDVSGSAR